ncbi:Autophagy-related protein 37 [Erysiphe necator]|uniref:Putative acyl binding family protein n=1 Tax=Uncinula necator TaxID=52586 RepID=A0A0B1P637_UNCNE|nr:Autophagy-related protein 37 [Erysiphe necator]KHJ33728.1 putative acyl binding family protein [Erysiphe necator]
MADSVDRVFVHALNTVKKIPKAGALRPPPEDRLRLYGLYKQAMEGDVDGVMERPASVGSGVYEPEDIKKDRAKYDSWDSQRGISRTEAKRKYVEALIETMHRYANTTADARALVDELEFVWNQIKNNVVSSNGSSPRGDSEGEKRGYRATIKPNFQTQNMERPMRILSPKSQDDDIERDINGRPIIIERDDVLFEGVNESKGIELVKWRKSVEHTLVKLTTEVAALREQITSGREYRGKRRKSFAKWISRISLVAVKHILIDVIILAVLLLWMRRKKDRRFEDLFRQALGVGREYIRKVLPSR